MVSKAGRLITTQTNTQKDTVKTQFYWGLQSADKRTSVSREIRCMIQVSPVLTRLVLICQGTIRPSVLIQLHGSERLHLGSLPTALPWARGQRLISVPWRGDSPGCSTGSVATSQAPQAPKHWGPFLSGRGYRDERNQHLPFKVQRKKRSLISSTWSSENSHLTFC